MLRKYLQTYNWVTVMTIHGIKSKIDCQLL